MTPTDCPERLSFGGWRCMETVPTGIQAPHELDALQGEPVVERVKVYGNCFK